MEKVLVCFGGLIFAKSKNILTDWALELSVFYQFIVLHLNINNGLSDVHFWNWFEAFWLPLKGPACKIFQETEEHRQWVKQQQQQTPLVQRVIRLIFLFVFYILYNVKNIHKTDTESQEMRKEGRERRAGQMCVSAASGCCVSVCVSGVCKLTGSKRLLSVCAVQVVTWLSDSFSEVSMHHSTADQSGYWSCDGDEWQIRQTGKRLTGRQRIIIIIKKRFSNISFIKNTE